MLITSQHIFLFCLKPNTPGVLSTGDKVLLLPLKNAGKQHLSAHQIARFDVGVMVAFSLRGQFESF